MAYNFQKVVGLLGENLASFLKLTDKLLVQWGIDPKKLFHTINHIRKDELMGLMDGTYQIVPKEKSVEVPVTEDLFGLVYESDYVTVPDMVTVNNYCNSKWDKTLAGATPSNLLETGMKKKIRVYKPKRNYSSEKAVDFVNSISGAKLYGLPGLAVAEITNGSNLPKDKWLLSFDNKDNLSVDSNGVCQVPHLYLDSVGSVSHRSNDWGGGWDTDYYLVVLCD